MKTRKLTFNTEFLIECVIWPLPALAAALAGDTRAGSYDLPCSSRTDTGDFSYFNNSFVVSCPAALDASTLMMVRCKRLIRSSQRAAVVKAK
jgi:hypothetical protein